MTVDRMLARFMMPLSRSSTIKTIIAAVGMTSSQPIHHALKRRLTTMSAKSIAAGSVVVSGGIPGSLTVPAKLRHHLRENRLMAMAGRRPFDVCMLPGSLLAASEFCRHLVDHRLVTAAGCLPWCLRPERLLPRSVAVPPELRHRLFQCDPMTVGNSLSRRYGLDV